MTTQNELRSAVSAALARSPIIGVVRTHSLDQARRQARLFADSGIELVEITFTVPGGSGLVRELLDERDGAGPPFFGMGTVTHLDRFEEARAAGSELIVSPNSDPELLGAVHEAGLFLAAGALSPTEIVTAHRSGADIVKVYPLPAVGGPDYLSVVRGPLGDIPMLAAGGYGIDDIPAYAAAGAVAFGIGGPLLGADDDESRRRIARALSLARGEEGR